MADVIITPASGLIDFQNTSGISSASIQLDGNGNLSISAAAGDIEIGDTSSDIFVGDGVANVDIVFEENGEIRGLSGKTITFGQSDSYLAFAGDITGTVDFAGGLNVSGVSTFQANVDLGDDDRLRFGDSQDLQIYHDGSQNVSYIRDTGSGSLLITTNGPQILLRNGQEGEDMAIFNRNGAVELYHDDAKKFETTGAGVTVTGITSSTVLYAEGGTYDAGSDSETDAAIVIKEEGSIYTQDNGNLLRVLIEKKSDIINIGQLNTSLIDGIHLRPGTTGGRVKLHAGGSSDAVKLETTNDGVSITGIATATSFSGSGSSLTGLTGASAGSYGSTGLTPVITVDANGRITGITTVTTAGSGGGLAEISDDTTPQLGGDLDLNSNDITGTGNMNVTGIITATSFSGNIISESSVPNSALVNTTIYLGGVNIALGATDATPAFDLQDATNYPYSSLTGISTDIVYDTTPQLGGNLDLNSNNITGTGNIDITGTLDVSNTATFGADADDVQIFGTTKILRMGGSNGFKIQEEGTSAQITQGTGNLRFFYDSGNQYKWAIFNNAGSVELYHANNKKFETSNTGVTITGTASATSFSGSGSSLTGLTGASAATYGSSSATPVITVDANGRITGITTAAVSGGGGDVVDDTTPQLGGTLDTNGNLIRFGDSSGGSDDRLKFGTGNDLQIYHNGSNSYVSQQSDVGDLYIVSLNDDNDIIIQTDDGSGSTTDYFRADGSTGEAKLFYYGSEKIKTVTTGVTITGTASATEFSGGGSNLTGLTGASAATYGSSTVTPIITVDSNGRITGITTAATAGGGGGGSGTVTGISSDGEIVGTGVTAINFVGTGITVSITGSTADITIPTSEKTVHREVATEGQTVVPASGTVEYTVGHCDVYLNGSKLDSTEYTATNGTSVTLTTGASVGDIIEVIGFQVGVELNLVGLADLVDDTTPQLGGNLDLNSRLIQGTGGINITGIVTATSFSGSGANLTSIPNSALDNSTISVGGVTFNLGGTDTTPAFNLSDATNYPYTSLTGISTEIVYDTTPQLGGNLDLNSNNITGTGNMNVTGIITATSFTGNITGNVVGDVTGDVTGTADNATNVTVADESSDTSCFPLFVTAATGDLAPKSGSNLTFDSSAGILGATTFQGNLDVAGLLKEGVNIVNGKLSANTNIDLANGMVHYFDTTETATSTPNIRVNASTTLDSAMSVGEAITVVLISSAAAAGYSAQLTIDGAAVTERWLGGSAPSEGGASGLDVYTYTIIKVTSAPVYSVLANLVNFA